jgi:hypothetical protein
MLLITPHSTDLLHEAPMNKEAENLYITGESKTFITAFTTAHR